MTLIETDDFPFEFLSTVAERESWRKEIHRPIYHVHKWWAKRLGSVFRGILLGCVLDQNVDLRQAFYQRHCFSDKSVLDPFMGSGTTIGEAHKLGFTVLGRDINPVAANAVRVALGPLDEGKLKQAISELHRRVGYDLQALYRSHDSHGRPCDVLYYFWVMQTACPCCSKNVDLFPSWIIARNAYPNRKPRVHVLCPACGNIFGCHSLEANAATCPSCNNRFDATVGTAKGNKAVCSRCRSIFTIVEAVGRQRPQFRAYGKLVVNASGDKEYLPVNPEDLDAYENSTRQLAERVRRGELSLPSLPLSAGYNTRQAMNYGFLSWRDFFNDRQLLALCSLHRAIAEIPDESTRGALLTLFSGILEFNNMFASYKGEGTGAVRHMFSHHILKPERTPIEANVWGTSKSSGSFSTLFRSRLLRAIDYRRAPTEVMVPGTGSAVVASPPFSGAIEEWPTEGPLAPRAIYLSCGDSSQLELPDQSVDLVVTDPPFFDNVHYSELADFFYSWQQLTHGIQAGTTRNAAEVQDADPNYFAAKLRQVFHECYRVLASTGMLVFTYHHSRDEGWNAVIDALLQAGFKVVNAQPIKAEMSVATPKSQAKEPIQIDVILVCRKIPEAEHISTPSIDAALMSARMKLRRLESLLKLSRNDRKVVLYGQLLTTIRCAGDIGSIGRAVELELEQTNRARERECEDGVLGDHGALVLRATSQYALWDSDSAYHSSQCPT